MKRRIAILWGYVGRGYHGLQFNKDLHTVEKHVIEILLKLGYITEMNSKDANKIKMKSASRTDKGVSACFNVTVCKIQTELTEEVTEAIREEFAKNNFRLYKICQVCKTFIPHRSARSREYKYLIPTALLTPAVYGSDPILSDKPTEKPGVDETKEYPFEMMGNKQFFKNKVADKEAIEKLQSVLNLFEGTKDYRNFTSTGNTNATKRHIRRIELRGVKIVNDIEYVEIDLFGDSFVLHQIRKMMSFTVFNCRYVSSIDKIKTNFDKAFSEAKYNIFKSPPEFLYLFNITFEDFNIRTQYEVVEVDEEVRTEFEQSVIQKGILVDDHIQPWLNWVNNVNFHTKESEDFIE